MKATVRTLAILFAMPPVALLALAHLVRSDADAIWWIAAIAIATAAIAAIGTSGWSRPVQLIVGALYGLAAVPLLPLLGLLAACTVPVIWDIVDGVGERGAMP